MRAASIVSELRGWHMRNWLKGRDMLCGSFMQFILGALLAAAFAPYDVWPLAVICLLGFYHAQVTARTVRDALIKCFWFAYGFSIAAHYWIAYSLLIDAAQFGWLVPFCVLGLSAAMAAWWVVGAFIFWHAKPAPPVLSASAFCLVFVLIEYAKSFGIFGFPWNLMGYTLLNLPALAQFASIAGVYGLSALVLLSAATFYHARSHPKFAASVLVLLAALYVWGHQRMQTPLVFTETTVRLVQPNIAQNMKWSADAASNTMQTLESLSRQPASSKVPDIVIWPETALPYTISSSQQHAAQQSLISMMPQGTNALIAGAVRSDDKQNLYNSIVWISGESFDAYDKFKLVPFGEFVPFRQILPIDKITPGGKDFSRGVAGKVLKSGALKARPLVCYESIFSHLAGGESRPDFLLNLTNDAWFGDSPGPYQHLAMARMRAIEQGFGLLRSANTGVSAVISPYGKMLMHLPLNSEGVIDHQIPEALPTTFFAKFSHWLMIGYISFLLLIFMMLRCRKINSAP